MEFCKTFRFERMGAFAYSEEDGTPAASLPDQVQPRVLTPSCSRGLSYTMAVLCHQQHHSPLALCGDSRHSDAVRVSSNTCFLLVQVPVDVRQARRDELISQQQGISQGFAELLVGKEVSC